MKCTVTLAGWLPTTKFLNEILLVERAPRDQVPPVGLLWPNYISLSPERLKFVCLIQFYWNFAVWFPLVERAATWPSPPGGTLHQKFGSACRFIWKKKKCLNSRNEEIDSNYENRKKFPPTFSPRRHIFCWWCAEREFSSAAVTIFGRPGQFSPASPCFIILLSPHCSFADAVIISLERVTAFPSAKVFSFQEIAITRPLTSLTCFKTVQISNVLTPIDSSWRALFNFFWVRSDPVDR